MGPEAILATLDVYDRKMGIDRPPHEADLFIRLNMIDRLPKKSPTKDE